MNIWQNNTFNKNSFDFSIIIVTRNRNEEIKRAFQSIKKFEGVSWELIIVDNGSTIESKRELISTIKQFGINNVRIIEVERNLGVAGGRNVGIVNSSGNFLFFIDDDAVVPDSKILIKAREIFESKDDVAAIACNVINMRTLTLQLSPFLDKERNYVLSFIGAGHFIRNSLFRTKKLPLYPSSLFYGFEEYYLSYLIYDLGMSILFAPELVVLHFPSANTRLSKDGIILNNIVNKAIVNSLLFPEKYRKTIVRNMYLRLLKYFWRKPNMIRRGIRFYHERLNSESSARKLSEKTAEWLIKSYKNIL
ncbi:hypothetical protein TRQ7_01600 [Thermotoga sp. RQ7]|uniref:glycosyltransferase family 2 protein n=1 Tax=Thermotoga sp. RQ7 TaxID=126738 RepID=UPI0005A312DE|nr:glycosyltransferase [Thermotoga sp. RQ7]AJG40169.1 hypothetical protein TRQ7_01600 [Thermotoga sp. RQ7]